MTLSYASPLSGATYRRKPDLASSLSPYAPSAIRLGVFLRLYPSLAYALRVNLALKAGCLPVDCLRFKAPIPRAWH